MKTEEKVGKTLAFGKEEGTQVLQSLTSSSLRERDHSGLQATQGVTVGCKRKLHPLTTWGLTGYIRHQSLSQEDLECSTLIPFIP